MKRLGRQLMALGVLGLIVSLVVGASGPGPELSEQMGVVGAIAVFALVGGFLLWLVGIVFGSEGKRAAAPVTVTPGAATKKCPQCAEVIQQDARICRFCRYEFAGAAATAKS